MKFVFVVSGVIMVVGKGNIDGFGYIMMLIFSFNMISWKMICMGFDISLFFVNFCFISLIN